MNKDPIGVKGGFNLYGYVANRPGDEIDSFGLTLVVDANASDAFKKKVANAFCYSLNRARKSGDRSLEI